MNCKKCGSKIRDGNLFCTICGQPVIAEVDEKNIENEKLDNKNGNGLNRLKRKNVFICLIVVVIICLVVVTSIISLNHKNIDSNQQTIMDSNTSEKEFKDPVTAELEETVQDQTEQGQLSGEDLLEIIYSKYPELKSKEGYICTDGEQYWILDKSGKKVYFDDLESFESALVMSYTSDPSANYSQNIDNENNSSGKLTIQDNESTKSTDYSKGDTSPDIREGMTYSEVIALLGKPQSTSSTQYTKNCVWIIGNDVLVVNFQGDRVFLVEYGKNATKEENKLDPETTHFIRYSTGFKLTDYTTQLDEWGIKYKVNKVQNLNYDDNVVIDIEPNFCNIDKNTVVTFTVSDNTYDMSVVVDTQYLLNLANNKNNYEYGDEIQLTLKINGKLIFSGKTEVQDINQSLILGNIQGKTTDTYNVEATIDGVTINQKINYNIRCNKDSQRFEIYKGGNIGAG
ncbi:MAG: zinc ribbon domain-containing protein [Bacilli bacterium]|nr:zinc ribbon domain-containing protein [Bacilli bacterium]